jgi:NAD(P)-dependent dehydrogenase (short-subunit alcohol dehydrogenase family)
MSSTNLVAFILGAGTHIGAAVAGQLREKGYRVALGSRNPKPTSDSDAYFNVKVDVQRRESIEEAFDTVVQKLGPINVVIYNGMSLFLLVKYKLRRAHAIYQLLLSLHHRHLTTSSQFQSMHTMTPPRLAWVHSPQLRKPF